MMIFLEVLRLVTAAIAIFAGEIWWETNRTLSWMWFATASLWLASFILNLLNK